MMFALGRRNTVNDELAPYAIQRLDWLKRRENIGAGSYGVVCEVKANGLPCIAKRLHDVLTNEQHVSQQERKAISERFRDECILLSRLRHPNIVQFLGVHYGRDRYDLTLVMERMHMDLETAIERFPSISLPIKLRILLDASYGLMHLHCQTPPIVHRDFTATNILLSLDMRAKVADLGVSKILDLSPQHFTRQTKCPGALGYMPPEAIQQNPVYGVKLDVFSFGHLALYTVNQQFPEVYELGPAGYKTVRNGTAQLAKRMVSIDMMGRDHCLHRLVTSCLQDSPKKRPTTAQVNSTLQDLTAHHPVKDSHATAKQFTEHFKTAAQYEEQKEELSKEVKELREKFQVASEELERFAGVVEDLYDRLEDAKEELKQYKGLEESVLAMKKTSDVSMQNALEETGQMFELAQEYKRQADSLKQQVAQHEKENTNLVQELIKVRSKLKDANEELEHHRNLEESIAAMKQMSDASVQKALEEAKETFKLAQVYRRQADSLIEQELRCNLRELQLDHTAVQQSIKPKVTAVNPVPVPHHRPHRLTRSNSCPLNLCKRTVPLSPPIPTSSSSSSPSSLPPSPPQLYVCSQWQPAESEHPLM